MKIDWKVVAQSPGYKSLKAAYVYDVSKRRHVNEREKQQRFKQFQWVIGRAMHYASRLNKPLTEILNEWEAKRTFWWVNYYQETRQPKLPSGKPRNVKHIKPETYWRRDRWRTPRSKEWFHNLRKRRTQDAQFVRKHHKGKKPRWSQERKAREARRRKYRQQNL